MDFTFEVDVLTLSLLSLSLLTAQQLDRGAVEQMTRALVDRITSDKNAADVIVSIEGSTVVVTAGDLHAWMSSHDDVVCGPAPSRCREGHLRAGLLFLAEHAALRDVARVAGVPDDAWREAPCTKPKERCTNEALRRREAQQLRRAIAAAAPDESAPRVISDAEVDYHTTAMDGATSPLLCFEKLAVTITNPRCNVDDLVARLEAMPMAQRRKAMAACGAVDDSETFCFPEDVKASGPASVGFLAGMASEAIDMTADDDKPIVLATIGRSTARTIQEKRAKMRVMMAQQERNSLREQSVCDRTRATWKRLRSADVFATWALEGEQPRCL